MATIAIESYPIPIRPAVVAERRIVAALVSGKLLSGVKWDRELKVESLGKDSLPLMQPLSLTWSEDILAGAGNPVSRGNIAVSANGRVTYFVIARKEYGFYRRDDANAKDGMGALEWAARLMDVIEGVHITPGGADTLLDGTCVKPLILSVKESYVSEFAQGVQVEMSYFTVPYTRAGRCN